MKSLVTAREYFNMVYLESNAAGLVLRPALKTGFSEMGWGSTPLLSATIFGVNMINNYCRHLKEIPIDYEPLYKIQKTHDLTKLMIFNYPVVDKGLKEFLSQHGLMISMAEVFYIPPQTVMPIHVDSDVFSNCCKLNWIIGGGDMIWYEPLMNKPLHFHTTPIGTKYLLFEADEVREVYRDKIGRPSLVNAGLAHNVHNNTDEGRWCISHNVNCLKTRKKVEFLEVAERLKEYIVECGQDGNAADC